MFNGDGLAGMESLQELDMEMGIESLEPLRNLKNLRVLSVVNGPALEGSFQSMEPLSGLTQLESLEIGIRQADVDLSCLSGLTKLRNLYIQGTMNKQRRSNHRPDPPGEPDGAAGLWIYPWPRSAT